MMQFKEDYGIKIIQEYKKEDINKLKANLSYQRGIERPRVNAVKQSIQQYNFWPQCPIIVNSNYEIVDGQQRWTAAKEIGLKEVPITILEFPSIEAEACFYSDVNNYNTKQTVINFWHARYISKHPVALLLYKLEQSPTSFFKDKIALKGKGPTTTKFTIPATLFILNLVVTNRIQHHRVDDEDFLLSKILNYSYREIEAKCNIFLTWFFKAFGNSKKANPTPYSTSGLYAICRFYRKVKNEGHFKKGDILVANKMSKYPFTNTFNQMTHRGRYESLISHYNTGKHAQNRLDYREDF